MGSVLKWRLSPNPQRKEKKTVKWDPKVCYLRSLDAVVGDSLIWLGHNSFFLQLAGKRIMFDPVFGSIPFVKRQSEFPANPDIFTGIDYLLVSHDHFDHLDKKSIARLLKNNPQMKLFSGLGTGELIQGWFPEMKVIEAGWYQQMEDEGLKITFLPAQHWSKRSVRDGGQRLWGASCCKEMESPFITVVTQVIPATFVKSPVCSEHLITLCWVSGHINLAGLCVPIIYRLTSL